SPQLPILQERLAKEADRGLAMVEQGIVEPLKREAATFLAAVVFAELKDLQLAKRVEAVTRIECAALRFLARRRGLVITILNEESRRLIDRHVLAVHAHGNAQAADAQQRLLRLLEAIFGVLDA